MPEIDPEIITNVLRHYAYLHEHPELSFEEYQTTAYIRQFLTEARVEYVNLEPTGILGFIPGTDTTHTIALRADMDALPVLENAKHPYLSQYPGKMHACGHDLHTAILLGAVEYLIRQPLPTNLLLIFQPAEEVLPGGAQDVIQHDFFKAHFPEWIVALHAEPDLQTGQAGICPGQYMASGDEIYITLEGPGGHAALPEKSADLVLIASHIIVALQQITSRNASPFTPTVLTFGNIKCTGAMNIIPKEIKLEGTFRTLNEGWRTKAKEHIRQITTSIAESMGARPTVEIIEGYPSLYNDPVKAELAIQLLKAEFGEKQVLRLNQRMTTEDFARYSQITPVTFIRLGVNSTGKLHTPDFFPDLNALQSGIRILCTLILNYTLLCQNS